MTAAKTPSAQLSLRARTVKLPVTQGPASIPSETSAPPALIRVRDLAVSFGETTAVSGLSFELVPGRCVALVGESGSGKSVSARSLLGLVGPGSRVEAAELSLAGRDLQRLRQAQWQNIRGKEIGLVLQDALVSLDPLLPVGKEIAEPLQIHTRLTARQRSARVNELLLRVGITDPEERSRQYPHQLSGGLRQRALIASALAVSPPVLIADEPTTALDVTVQAQVLELLKELKEQGTALLLVSHDLAVVASLADEILVLRQGTVVERGTPDEVLRNPTHKYTRQLIAAVPSGTSRGQRLSPKTNPSNTRTSGRGNRPAVPAADATAASRPAVGTPVLEAHALNKSYRGRRGHRNHVVKDVSFTLGRGKTLGIVGESGSGKSTVANIVLGLVPPDTGDVLLDGQPWSAVPERLRRPRRSSIQTISQDPLGSFDPRYDVKSLLREALQTVGVSASERNDRAVELLEQVGLDARHLTRHPLELSGGQRQRVAISRALATNPEVIVCDEPVSALDVSIQAQVLDLLQDLQHQMDLSLLFISHDLGVVHHLAHDVAVMCEGRIVEFADADRIFTEPQHQYTQDLIRAIPRL